MSRDDRAGTPFTQSLLAREPAAAIVLTVNLNHPRSSATPWQAGMAGIVFAVEIPEWVEEAWR